MTIVRTIRARKKRICHDRALKFTAASSHRFIANIDNRYDFGTGDFCINLFFQRDADAANKGVIRVAGTSSIDLNLQSNASYRLFIDPSNAASYILNTVGTSIGNYIAQGQLSMHTIRRNGNQIEYLINCNLIVSADCTGQEFNFGATPAVHLNNSFSGSESFTCNNVCIINGTVSNNNLKLIHALGGVIPSALYANVLNHWPLTQKSYYDDGVNIKAWDVVGQYDNGNAAIHANLINYTDAEVGADGTVNPASIIDIYTKLSYVHSGLQSINEGLKFDSSISQRRLNINAPLISTDTQEFTLILAVKLDVHQAGNKYLFSANDGGIASTNNYISVLRNGTTGQIQFTCRRANDTEVVSIVDADVDDTILSGVNILAFRVKNNVAEAYINGILIGSDLNAQCPDISSFTTIRINGYTGSGFEASATHMHTAFYSRFLSKKEILKICDNTFINPLNDDSLELMPDYQNPFDSGGGTLKLNDLSANGHNIVIQNFTDLTDVQNNLIDIDTLR